MGTLQTLSNTQQITLNTQQITLNIIKRIVNRIERIVNRIERGVNRIERGVDDCIREHGVGVWIGERGHIGWTLVIHLGGYIHSGYTTGCHSSSPHSPPTGTHSTTLHSTHTTIHQHSRPTATSIHILSLTTLYVIIYS